MSRRLLLLDVAAVALFALIGRRAHEEGLTTAGVARTAAPFLAGLGAGWLLTRAWRAPASLPVGAGVAATTVAGGMALRRVVFDDGTAASFVVVASVFLGTAMLGWRAAARAR